MSLPSRRVDANRVAVRPVRAKAVPTGADVENGTIDLVVSTEEARRTLQFDKVILDEREGPVIFVTGVAIGSAAEAAGVTPGQRLVAVSDPVNDGELWFIDGTERLAFVNDAIRSTRAYECTVVVESEVSVTKAAVDAVRGPPATRRGRGTSRGGGTRRRRTSGSRRRLPRRSARGGPLLRQLGRRRVHRRDVERADGGNRHLRGCSRAHPDPGGDHAGVLWDTGGFF